MNPGRDARECPDCGNFTATFTARKSDGWRCPCGAYGKMIKIYPSRSEYMAVLGRTAQPKGDVVVVDEAT